MRGNQEIENKQEIEDFEMKNDIHRYSDSRNQFSEIFYVDFMSLKFFIFFTYLNIIKIKSEVNVNF